MNRKSSSLVSLIGGPSLTAIATALALTATLKVQAAVQTWTNAPVDATWANTNNWVSHVAPGAFVPGGSTQNGDTVVFNTPLAGGSLGGSANPITLDAIVGTAVTNREVGSVLFDTANCGAYVIGSPTGFPLLLTSAYNNATFGSNVTVSATVINPIAFSGPVRFHQASSSNTGYNITNNAVPTTATLSFNIISNDAASSRPLTLTLAGSNTGSNVITHFDDNAGANGSIHLIKSGTGRWVFPGPNDFPQKKSGGDNVNASIAIIGGTLEVLDPGALGAITVANLSITNTGVLQIDGITPNNNGFTLQKGGTLQMNGSGTVNGITLASNPGNVATVATTSASDVLSVGNAVNTMTGGANDTILHVAGPGTVVLSQSANYVGRWSLDAGSTQLGTSASLGTGANLNIGAGASLDASILTTGGGTYTLTTLALSAGGTGTTVGTTAANINASGGILDLTSTPRPLTLTYTPTSFSGDATHPSLYISSGTLSLGNNTFTVNNASGTPLGVGTYTLIAQASGSVTDAGGYAVSVTGSGKAAGTVAAIQVSGGNVNLVLTAYIPKNLVWTGNPANANWDIATDASFLNGAAYAVFNNSDNVTFNSVGSTNPVVTLTTTLAPGSMVVDTSANNYTFSGSGSVAGTTSLVKQSPGILILNTINSYSGGTVVSNGVIQVGANNAIPSTGAGDVTVVSPGIIDLWNSDTINGLNGSGTVDITSGGSSTLTIGNNNDSGVFSGVIQNTTGTVALTLAGNGTETLSGANTYSGATTINAGTLLVQNYNALGSGGSTVTLNAGTLDLATNVVVGVFAGTGGTIANNTTSTTNTLVVTNTGTINSSIVDGAGGGGLKLLITGGTLRLNGVSSYSGGTIVEAGAGLAIGGGAANAGAGGVLCSNGVTISQPNTGSGSSAPGNPFTTVDGATVTFTSGTTANAYNGQFYGSALATNVFNGGNMSVGGSLSFSNFLGTVIITNGGVRWFNAACGGDNTIFNFVNGGGGYARDGGDIVHLGALFGNGAIGGPSVSFGSTYWIGAKGIDSEYSGSIAGSNNVVKVGAGRLTLDGAPYTLNTDSTSFTNLIYTGSQLTYLNNTTISNGVLALSAPNTLTNSPVITLASASAVLDASNMGYITNFNDGSGNADSSLITNGLLEIVGATANGTPESLDGFGTITGSLLADSGSTLNPGLPTGELNVSGTAEIAGAVNMNISITNSPVNSELAAATITIDNTATLVVTNVGPGLFNGTTFHMFSHGLAGAGFTSVVLPAKDPTGLTNYVWANNLVANGSITLTSGGLSPVANYSTNITASVSGGVLTVAWPATHLGWELMVQTNSLTTGLGKNWVTNYGTASVTSTNFTINPANGTVFYRLVHP